MSNLNPPERLNPPDLLLDPHNPRLRSEEEGLLQPELLRIMVERFKVRELAESIVATGYLTFDPLIAYRDNNGVIVLEGNRRIAALKLLLDPSLAPERDRATWESLASRLTDETRTAIASIEVHVYETREDADVQAYIGFRHVTGVLQWPALEKASFIARLIDKGWSYQLIAERIGSRPKHVERHYIGFRLVRQAQENNLPGAENMEEAFGVLMRSLQSPGVLEFLGISFPGDPALSREPVPQAKIENFRSFVKWTFGTSDTSRLLRDSRQLTQWGRILSSPEAVAYLQRSPNPNFERAYFRSGGEVDSLIDFLFRAVDALEQSVPLVPLHKDDPTVRSTVERSANYLLQILGSYPDLRRTFGE